MTPVLFYPAYTPITFLPIKFRNIIGKNEGDLFLFPN